MQPFLFAKQLRAGLIIRESRVDKLAFVEVVFMER